MGWINPHLRHLPAVIHGFQVGFQAVIPMTGGGLNSSCPVWSHPMRRCEAGEGILDAIPDLSQLSRNQRSGEIVHPGIPGKEILG